MFIDSFLPEISSALQAARAVIVTAAPGAGKTTRVPPALVADGPVLLLQPRRIAARAIAARIAVERGWTLGREVGWQVRFDRRFTPDTQLLVVTEGILTARAQADPLLSAFRTIVLDEFHERSIHGDLAIALARQAWRARDDLRVVVMSATLDASAVSSFLDGCPVVHVPGRRHPLDISYAPGQDVGDAVREMLAATPGNVLCFLPGAGEIRRAMTAIAASVPGDIEILPLHGSLTADEQDAALRESARRRVIVATNIAETSLTVPGVTAVVDAGLHKVARYDHERAIDSLETERITADAADQRAGRAGRLAPGVVRRLWDSRDRLRAHREPDIHRMDLSGTALDVIAWGGDPRRFEWFEAPSRDGLDVAIALLERLGLVANNRLTAIGEQTRRLPLHPRLARMIVAADGARDVVRACAVLSERHLVPARIAATTSDVLSAVDEWRHVPPHVQRAADHIQSAVRVTNGGSTAPIGESAFRRAILAGYPDRVAQRRAPGVPTFLLASGTGATLGRESGVVDAEFIIAVDVTSGSTSGRDHNDARIRMASRVERDWLTPTSSEIVHRVDERGRVRAARVDWYGAIALGEHPVAVDETIAAELLAARWIERGPREDDGRLLRRLAFAGHDVDLPSLVRDAAFGARSLDDVKLSVMLSPSMASSLDRDAPDRLTVPSGRSVPIEYHADGSVSVSVTLQELFGLAETPTLGARRVPITVSLLAPNGRPVQVTQDLRSFWTRTYPEVRKELRGRYPKHPWPEDPWTAPPTARAKPRPR